MRPITKSRRRTRVWTYHRFTDWRGTTYLPFGEGGDELAAEVGNVGDDAAPD